MMIVPRNDPVSQRFNLRCNISRIIRMSCRQPECDPMTAAPSVRTHRNSLTPRRRPVGAPSVAAAASLTAILISTLLLNRYLAKKAERDNPPRGHFLEANGVRLHYIERGEGDTVVLLHGNGSMIQDFESSGLIDLVAKRHRVIVFDRPGFGHSDRPRGVVWTPDAQAKVMEAALAQLNVSNTIVLGHSWGASVAVAMALRNPGLVRGLVLASGYYYPTSKFETLALSIPSLPLVGDLLSQTLAPFLSRAMWPIMLSKIFGPRSVPKKFKDFPKEMALRPSQIRASAAESALMIPDAFTQRHRYVDLKMPVFIIAGDQDGLIDIESQSARLHGEVSQSSFRRIAGNGHMIQQTATDQVMSAIDEVAHATSMLAAAE
jgi:pimeloyl-ACP methyl ester carboxylesterase